MSRPWDWLIDDARELSRQHERLAEDAYRLAEDYQRRLEEACREALADGRGVLVIRKGLADTEPEVSLSDHVPAGQIYVCTREGSDHEFQ